MEYNISMSKYPQLDSSFAESRKRGVSDDVIRTEALKIGWAKEDVEAAFASIPAPVVKAPVPPVVTAPQPVRPPVQQPITAPAPAEAQIVSAHKKGGVLGFILIFLVVILVIIIGGGAYLYFAKIGPFEEKSQSVAELPVSAETDPETITETPPADPEQTPEARSMALKAAFSSIRARAQAMYGKDEGYGFNGFPIAACAKTQGTLFGDDEIYGYLTSATANKVGSATCVSEFGSEGIVSAYAISAPLPDKEGYSYCVDNTGAAKEIKGVITSSVCK